MPRRPASLALAALALLPASATAASWSAPKAITSSGVAYRPAVAVGSPDVLGITYARTIHGTQRIEYRRAVSGRFRPIVLVDRMPRDQSPALTFAGHTATVAWVRADHVGRVVVNARVNPQGAVSDVRGGGGAPHQYGPRFPDPAQLLFNTRATSTVARVSANGTIAAGVKLPRGATFDATIAVLPDGDRLALWSDRGRVYTAREVRGTFKFTAPVRLSDIPSFARDPRLLVTSTGYAMALWRQSGSVRAASLPPGQQRFDVSRELVAAVEAAEGLGAIATTAGDVLVTYVSSPGDSPAGELRAFHVAPGTDPTRTHVLTAPGERTRGAQLAVDANAPWAAWTTAGQGTRHAVRVARVPIDAAGGPSAPRTLSGAESTTTAAPAFALSLRGRGIVAWATATGRIRAVTVTRAGL